jgi:hypothetical protein
MAYFQRKNPMQKLEAELAKLNARARLLDDQRAACAAAFDRATEQRQRFMLEGDLEDTKTCAKLQAAVDTASSALLGFDDAIATLTSSIAVADDSWTPIHSSGRWQPGGTRPERQMDLSA